MENRRVSAQSESNLESIGLNISANDPVEVSVYDLSSGTFFSPAMRAILKQQQSPARTVRSLDPKIKGFDWHLRSRETWFQQQSLQENQVILIMVGLPGRGKSFLSKRMAQWLNWNGHITRVFNVGQYRRKLAILEEQMLSEPTEHSDNIPGSTTTNNIHLESSFFDSTNERAMRIRQRAAEMALADMIEYLDANKSHKVAIYDATNSTRDRRKWLISRLTDHNIHYQIVFIESIVSQSQLIRENILTKLKTSPDFAHMDDKKYAYQQLEERILHYMAVYQSINEVSRNSNFNNITEVDRVACEQQKKIETYNTISPELKDAQCNTKPVKTMMELIEQEKFEVEEEEYLAFIKVFNLSSRILCNNIFGGIPQSLVPFLMSIHIGERSIYLSNGFYEKMEVVFTEKEKELMKIYTSSYTSVSSNINNSFHHLKSTSLSNFFDITRLEKISSLNEIDYGLFESMNLSDISSEGKIPLVNEASNIFFGHESRTPPNFTCAETYADLIRRLGPFILQIEQQMNPILIVADDKVLNILVSYFDSAMVVANNRHSIDKIDNTPYSIQNISELTKLAPSNDDLLYKFTPLPSGNWSKMIFNMK